MAKKRTSFDRLREATSPVSLPGFNFPISGASVTKPPEAWHIAVRGNIDLRQHHPSWYRLIGCITESELSEGLKSLVSMSMPPFESGVMQFDVGAFAINVIQDRWMIQTITSTNCDRIIDVASKVFRKLNDLPLMAFGINKSMVFELKHASSKQFLASRLIEANLALPSAKTAEARFFFSDHKEDSDTQIWMHPSPFGDQWLAVEYNEHHPLKDSPLEYFDLGALLLKDAAIDWKNATKYGEKVTLITEGS